MAPPSFARDPALLVLLLRGVLIFRRRQRSSAVTRQIRIGAIVESKRLVGLGYMQTEPREQLESAEALHGCAGDLIGALQAQKHRGVAGSILVRVCRQLGVL